LLIAYAPLHVADRWNNPPTSRESVNCLPEMKRMVEASRAEDGCVEYVYAKDLFDAVLYMSKNYGPIKLRLIAILNLLTWSTGAPHGAA
jgi:hypothetical protein